MLSLVALAARPHARGQGETHAGKAPAARSLCLCAILVVACSNGRAASTEVGFDAARAWKHLETLVALGPRPVGSQAIERTRTYIRSELEALNLEVVREDFVARTPKGEFAMANLYTDIEGKARSDASPKIVILCSHFDTKLYEKSRFVGANDGGSSTAVLLELARVLASQKPSAVTYRLLFSDGEEALREQWVGKDNTYGSRHHAQELQRTGVVERVSACIVIDLVGDADLRLFRESYSDPELLEIFFDAARRNGMGRHVDGQRMEVNDDHLSFMALDIPSIDLIDFDYGSNNRYWHSPEDTLDKCSAESLGVIGRIVLLGLPAVEKRYR